MKIILSRKAFDSGAGGVANPILPDHTMLPLPIPEKRSPIRYRDITLHGHNLGKVVSDLTGGRKKKVLATDGAHLDPDLAKGAIKRRPGWMPLFGQAHGDQTVLEKAGVGAGDVFLYFGWFRDVELKDGRYRFVPGMPNLHVIWGWLQIADMWDPDGWIPKWAKYHPHLSETPRINNTLYVAAKDLVLGGRKTGLPGAGTFLEYSDALQLTAPGESRRSVWRVPGWFRGRLGYHRDPKRWRKSGESVILQSVRRGQEFVIDVSEIPAATRWLKRRFVATASGEPDGERKDESCSSHGPPRDTK